MRIGAKAEATFVGVSMGNCQAIGPDQCGAWLFTHINSPPQNLVNGHMTGSTNAAVDHYISPFPPPKTDAGNDLLY